MPVEPVLSLSTEGAVVLDPVVAPPVVALPDRPRLEPAAAAASSKVLLDPVERALPVLAPVLAVQTVYTDPAGRPQVVPAAPTAAAGSTRTTQPAAESPSSDGRRAPPPVPDPVTIPDAPVPAAAGGAASGAAGGAVGSGLLAALAVALALVAPGLGRRLRLQVVEWRPPLLVNSLEQPG